MMRIIAFIVLAVLIYYYFRYLFRLLGLTGRKKQKNFRDSDHVNVHKDRSYKNNGKFIGGEYIDYEEVDKK